MAARKMILGSDSHTRYARWHHGRGGGGPSAGQAATKKHWDLNTEVVLVYLTGTPKRGVGPHDVAIALVKATLPALCQ